MISSLNFVNHVPAKKAHKQTNQSQIWGTLLWQYLYRLEENDMTVIVMISDCKNLNMHYYNFACS